MEVDGVKPFLKKSFLPVAGVFFLAAFAISPFGKERPKAAQEVLASQPDPVWPPPPDTPRVKWVRFIRDEYDVGAVKKSPFLDALAGKKRQIFSLQRPMSAAADPEGNVYVQDFNVGIVKFDFSGKRMVNLSASSGLATKNPTGIAADSKFLYVADSKRNSVDMLDHEGQAIRRFADPKALDWPVGVAVDEGEGLLFVVGSHSHGVAVFEIASGKLVRTIGRRGSKPGEFNFPTYLTILPGQRIAVVDAMNFRVQILRYDGKPLGAFGELGDRPGQFFRPKGIAADSDGNLWVVDASFQNIQIFDQSGRLLAIVGQGGQGKGEFALPLTISCTGDRLYVADQFNGRVQVLQYLPERGEKGGVEAGGK